MIFKKWQLPASFRGKPFYVQSDSLDAGRRYKLHEFPNKDVGYNEDLGRKDDTFSLECYTTRMSPGGYEAARDALIAAAKQRGPGKLVHPYYGEKEVFCTGITVKHTDKENGIAKFTLKFVELGEDDSPVKLRDFKSLVDSAASTGIGIFIRETPFTLAGLPGYVREASNLLMIDLGKKLVELYPHVARSVAAYLVTQAVMPSKPRLTRERLALLKEQKRLSQTKTDLPVLFNRHAEGLADLTMQPQRMCEHTAGLLGLLSCACDSHKQAYETQKQFWTYGEDLPPVPETTPARKAQATNQRAVVELVQRVSLFEAARCVPYMELESRTQALQIRDELTEQLDRAAETTDDDTVYRELESMRRLVVDDITRRAPSLAQLATYTPVTTSPALVVSYELYETPDRAEEIVLRNRIPHPGRLAGGVSLEVLRA